MNQHDQMLREALRMYMSAGSGNSTDFDIQAKAWSMAHQALAHVNETPKNKHDSDDVLKPEPLVRLTDEEIESLRHKTFSTNNPFCPCDAKTMRKAANAIMDAIQERNK